MAIKPIIRYGKFTPTDVDQSGEIRMRALAGLGQGISDIGEVMGKKEIAKRQQQAVLDAPTVGFEQGVKALETGEYSQTLGAGASQRAAAAQSAYVVSFDNLFAKTIQDAQASAKDSSEFLAITQGALEGLMTGYSNLPPMWLERAQTNAQQMIKTAVGPIIKKENTVALENSKIEFATAEENAKSLQSNLAFQGDLQGLQLARANQGLAHNVAIEQGIKSTQIETIKPQHIESLQYQYFSGAMQRNFYDNESLTLEQKLERAQGFIDDLRKRKSVAGINPNDPEKSLTLSKETQVKFADNLEKEMKAFFDGLFHQIGRAHV